MTRYRKSRLGRLLGVGAVGVLLLTTLVTGAEAKKPAPQTVASYELLGTVSVPTGTLFADTEIGGLSSIAYDARRRVYYSIADDQSQINPARFYTLEIDVSDGQLDDGDITFVGVTTLLNANRQPYAPGSLDPEGITVGRSGHLYISSEGITNAGIDPFVHRIDRRGRLKKELPIPEKFLIGPDVGVRQNLAFESLTATPKGRRLYTATEGALAQDGPAADVGQETLSRVIEYRGGRGAGKQRPVAEFVYVADAVADPPVPPDAFRVSGLVELLAIDNLGTFVSMERSFSVGVGNNVVLYETTIRGATDVSDIDDLDDSGVAFDAMEKRFLLDIEDDLGIIPDNLEGLAIGPRLADGRQLLIIVSDNNFNAFQTTQFIALALDVQTAP